MLRLGGITQLDVIGSRQDEIEADMVPRELETLGLPLEDVAAMRIRTKGKRRTGRKFEDIVVLARPDGTRVTLAEIGGLEASGIASNHASLFRFEAGAASR